MNIEEAKKNVTAYVYMECENMPKQVIKALDVLKDSATECEQYRALGTVEELKEAREKQVAKKPLKVKGDCYSRDKEGNEGYVVVYRCPRCKRQVLVNPLPCECGQKIDWNDLNKLDWSEEDE